MEKKCEICDELKTDLKNLYEKVEIGSLTGANDSNYTEIVFTFIDLIQKIFTANDFVKKFYPEKHEFKGICTTCVAELITAYKFYKKVQRINNNSPSLPYLTLPNLSKILPKASKSSITKNYSCNDVLKTSAQLKRHKKVRNPSTRVEKVLLNYCKYCKTYFDNKEHIEKHTNNEHNAQQYFCRTCNQKFNIKTTFYRHFEGKKCNRAQNYCFSCNFKEFECKKELRKHCKLYHYDDTKICSKENEFADLLPELPMNADELIMDIEFLDDFFLNQNENSSQFNDCWEALGLNIMNLENELEDLSIFTSEPDKDSAELSYKCPKCPQDFTNQHNLFLHLAHIHHESVLVCSSCGFKFNRFDEFVIHKAKHFKENFTDPNYTNIAENDLQKKLQCSKCTKTFKKKFNFLIHLCKNDSNVMVQCNFCTETFPDWKKMYEHQKHNHSKSFKCSICDEKEFSTLAGLKYHLKSHEGVKDFECPYCKKKFLASTNLNAHLKTIHAKFKFHVCKLCDERFATLGHLKKHVVSVHQKERNFLCSICSKDFAQSSHLNQHMEIHTGQRKYPCNYCSKGFSRKIDLKRHEGKRHEKEINVMK